jgi:hypothetical protein
VKIGAWLHVLKWVNAICSPPEINGVAQCGWLTIVAATRAWYLPMKPVL